MQSRLPTDGFAVATACGAEGALKTMRLIAASGYGSLRDHADAKEAGFERLFAKPLIHDTLALIMRA